MRLSHPAARGSCASCWEGAANTPTSISCFLKHFFWQTAFVICLVHTKRSFCIAPVPQQGRGKGTVEKLCRQASRAARGLDIHLHQMAQGQLNSVLGKVRPGWHTSWCSCRGKPCRSWRSGPGWASWGRTLRTTPRRPSAERGTRPCTSTRHACRTRSGPRRPGTAATIRHA